MANDSYIRLNTKLIAGTVSCDGGEVRGEGGSSNPQLVLPLTFRMANHPDQTMMAISQLKGWLDTENREESSAALCPPVVIDLVGGPHGYVVHTQSVGQASTVIEFRCYLSPAQVSELENRRHGVTANPFVLYLKLLPIIVGLRVSDHLPSNQRPNILGPWPSEYGTHSGSVVFWTAEIDVVRVSVESSRWATHVLPGLGYDQLRLIEVALPPPLPDQPAAAAQFDNAKVALDSRRYEDSVGACRGLLQLWNAKLGSSRNKPLGTVVGDEWGWSADDSRRAWLSKLWTVMTDFANGPHHPEGQSDVLWLDHRDARLTLMITALLSEYLVVPGRSS